MTAPEYVAPLGSGIDYTGLVVRAVDAEGHPVISRAEAMDWWQSEGDPYTGEGYRLAFKQSVPWLVRCYRIMVAEAMHEEHEIARQRVITDRIEHAQAVVDALTRAAA